MQRTIENNREPIAVSVPEAARLSGYSAGSIWAFIRKGWLRAVRVEGHRRTNVDYASLKKLLDPERSAPPGSWYCPNPKDQPRKRAGERDTQPDTTA
jgi:hypothetical protein